MLLPERGVRALATRRKVPLARAGSPAKADSGSVKSHLQASSGNLASQPSANPALGEGGSAKNYLRSGTLEDRLELREASRSGETGRMPSRAEQGSTNRLVDRLGAMGVMRGGSGIARKDRFRGERGVPIHPSAPRRKGRDQRRAWRPPVSGT